jgi:hypothetical protein
LFLSVIPKFRFFTLVVTGFLFRFSLWLNRRLPSINALTLFRTRLIPFAFHRFLIVSLNFLECYIDTNLRSRELAEQEIEKI